VSRSRPSVSWDARTLAALAVLAAGTPSVVTGQGIPVTVGVGAISTGAAQFDLPVVADMSARAEKLGSFVLTLRWNAAVLQFQGGVDGSFGGLVVNEDSASGGVLKLSGVNPAGVGGLVTLGVGRFMVLTNDTTTFRVAVQELYAAGTFADLTSAAVPLDRLFCGALSGTYGDVNRDGAVNGADALIVLTESVGLDVSQYAIGFGDVDGNGVRNPRDALIILSYAVGINTTSFRAGQTVSGNVCLPPGAQSYALNPVTAEALTGQEVSYYAFGLDSSGAALALRNVTWSSSNAGVASVNAAGLATALTAGTTTITARQNDTTIASGTLTVVTGRRTHWVDALAIQAPNQLGTSALPFGTLQDAVDVVAPGDTLRVRSGRYEGARIDRSLAIVGDTSAGGTRPRIGIADTSTVKDTVFSITTAAGRVLLKDLVLDTAKAGIRAWGVDTLELIGVDVHGAASEYSAVQIDTTRLTRLLRTRIFGVPDAGSGQGLIVERTGTFIVDSSLVSDFSGDGVYTYGVDSIDVRRSTLRHNGNAGLWIGTVDTATASRLVFSQNQVTQNGYYGVYAHYVRQGLFDHNVFRSSEYYGDALYLYGTRSATVAFLADTMDVVQADWLYLSQFDSLLVDSVDVRGGGYGGSVYDGRVVVLRNGRQVVTNYYGFYVSGRAVDSTTVYLRNQRFEGLSNQSYYYGGYGLEAYYATLDVEASHFTNLYYGLDLGYASLAIRRSAFDNSYYGIYGYCVAGPLQVDSVQFDLSYYGIYGSTCGATGVIAQVDSVDLRRASQGIQLDGFQRARVRQSQLTDVDYGISVTNSDTAQVDTVGVAALYQGIYLGSDTVSVATGNSVACGSDGYGIEADYGARATIVANTVTGACYSGIELDPAADTVEVRGNTVSSSGYFGVRVYATTLGSRVAVAGNTVTGQHPNGALLLYGSQTLASSIRADSNVIAGGVEAGILVSSGDTTRVRDNTITGIGSLAGSLSNEGAIVVEAGTALRHLLDIRRNRLSGNVSGIVINRQLTDTLVAATVDSNRIYGSTFDGIRLLGYSRVLAQRNVIDSVGRDAVHVDRSVVGDTLQVRFLGNNLTRSGVYGALNLDGGLIDARGNWWGDALGPAGTAGEPASAGDSVSVGVLWSPPLPSPAGDVLPPSPPLFAALRQAVSGVSRLVAPTAPVALPRRAPALPLELPQLNGARALPPEVVARWEQRQAEWRTRQAARVERQHRDSARVAERAAHRAQRPGEERR
jgi:hypothetical protein